MKLTGLNLTSVLLCLWVGPILTFTCGTEPDDDDESGDGLTWISTAGNDVDTSKSLKEWSLPIMTFTATVPIPRSSPLI